jgi:hypothetical protein
MSNKDRYYEAFGILRCRLLEAGGLGRPLLEALAEFFDCNYQPAGAILLEEIEAAVYEGAEIDV